MKTLTASLMILVCIMTGPVRADLQEIRVVLRCDDYGDMSSSTVAALLNKLVRECDSCMTLGVIPFNKRSSRPEQDAMNPFKVEVMRNGVRDGCFEIALHGYMHAHRSPVEHDSEFRGLPLDEQCWMLQTARKALEEMSGSRVRVFIPPWHSYDANTLRAVQHAGMDCLSVDFDARESSKGAANMDGLACVPQGCDLWSIQTHVDQARASGDPAPVVTALFHGYDFKAGSGRHFTEDWLRNLLTRLNEQQDVRVTSIASVIDDTPGLTIRHLHHLNKTQEWMRDNADFLRRFLGMNVARLLPEGVLSSPAHLRHVKHMVWTRLLVYTGTCMLLAGIGMFVAVGFYRHFRNEKAAGTGSQTS